MTGCAPQRSRIDALLHAWAAHRAGERCGGHLSGSRRGSGGLSRPEAGAHRLGEIEAVDHIVRSVLSRRQMRLVVARYVWHLPSDRQVAARLRLDRKYVGLALDDLREQIYKMLCSYPKRKLVSSNRHFS